MKQVATTETYIAKDIAAGILDLSERRVLELANAGKIRQKETFNPETKRRQTVLSAADVQRLADQRSGTAAPPPHASAPRELEAPQTAAVPHLRAWLTLDEAEIYTGLPASFIHGLIDRSTLPAFDVGIRPGGRWRVCRRDLDELRGVLIATAL